VKVFFEGWGKPIKELRTRGREWLRGRGRKACFTFT
jgi:hypothetical protein